MHNMPDQCAGLVVIGGRWLAGWLAVVLLVAGGCRTASPPQVMRAEPYRPVIEGRETTAVALVPATPEPATMPAPASIAEVGRLRTAEPRLRTLRSGDRIEIYLHGIPNPQVLPAVVDESGFVTMPLLGPVQAAGKTGSELERLIEKMYIEQEYYRSITCVVIPPPIEFFMRGEVRQPGRFPLHRDVTLLQAIALAGGYTEFAQPRLVKIQRGTNSFTVDARRIERGEETPPPIEPGDIIVVPRRWW